LNSGTQYKMFDLPYWARIADTTECCAVPSNEEKIKTKMGTAPAILIVEDEPIIRANVVSAIEAEGFEVLEAANADEAIRILESRSDIRVIFTDIQMPGSMDGLKLAHAVRDRWPPIKIIVTSGRERLTERDLPEGGRFIAKPYRPSRIADTLREWTA
jgi:CheY-like chemotaxis protein